MTRLTAATTTSSSAASSSASVLLVGAVRILAAHIFGVEEFAVLAGGTEAAALAALSALGDTLALAALLVGVAVTAIAAALGLAVDAAAAALFAAVAHAAAVAAELPGPLDAGTVATARVGRVLTTAAGA